MRWPGLKHLSRAEAKWSRLERSEGARGVRAGRTSHKRPSARGVAVPRDAERTESVAQASEHLALGRGCCLSGREGGSRDVDNQSAISREVSVLTKGRGVGAHFLYTTQ